MVSNIMVHQKDSDDVFQKTAEFLIGWLKLYQNIGQKTLLFLSGGSSVKLYVQLSEFIRTSDLDFGFWAIGQVDERFQPENKEDINAYQIEKTGLWDDCRQKNIPYYLVSQEGTLEDAAQEYNLQMKNLFEHFSQKIGVLGIGEDAHTAGLLPGYAPSWDKEDYFTGYKNNGRFGQRITVTPGALSFLDEAVVVASGEKKRQAIINALDPNNINKPDQYPAAVLQKMKKVDLFTDIMI